MKRLLPIMFASFAVFTHAQQCDPNQTDEKTWLPNGNGSAQLVGTDLIWQQCNMGERWNGQTCVGNAQTFDFTRAIKEAKAIASAEAINWRLPTNEELQMLISTDCRLPAIDQTVFPSTQNAPYWSSERFSFYAHVVSFDHGYTFSTQMKNANFVRLVRDR